MRLYYKIDDHDSLLRFIKTLVQGNCFSNCLLEQSAQRMVHWSRHVYARILGSSKIAYTSPDVKVTFSQCDICEKPYEAYDTDLSNPTSAVSEEELQH